MKGQLLKGENTISMGRKGLAPAAGQRKGFLRVEKQVYAADYLNWMGDRMEI